MEMRMEMKASLCVGEYCETAYNIEELRSVYCMEGTVLLPEGNAFLLDMSIMNDKLVGLDRRGMQGQRTGKAIVPHGT